MRREILAIVVHCTFKDDGCIWKGEVRHLEVTYIERVHFQTPRKIRYTTRSVGVKKCDGLLLQC